MDIPTLLCRNMSQRFVNNILKDLKSDISQHHFMILKLLSDKEQLYVSEIAGALSITKSQMTASVDKLLDLGFVERMHAQEDRRKIFLIRTQKGTEFTNAINQRIDAMVHENLANLSKEEMVHLEKGLEVLYKFCSIY